MENIKMLLSMYYRPVSAMSELMDKGSWVFAAILVLLVSAVFFWTINTRLNAAYGVPAFSQFYQPHFPLEYEDPVFYEKEYERAAREYENFLANRAKVPIVGDHFFKFFSFDANFLNPLLLILVFYVPFATMLVSFVGGVGRFGIIFRRDYGVFSVCTLMAWGAAHLPFAIAGLLLQNADVSPPVYFGIWCASSLYFGVLMIFALRTVFGVTYTISAVVVGFAWLSFSLGGHIFSFISPWLFSPFLLIFAFMYLSGYLRGEALSFGDAMSGRRNYKRHLQNATSNPNDADAHVQLGLIYLERRQTDKALDHFEKAIGIDPEEIDANYELGKIRRQNGEFQKALDHFAIVLEQNDKHAVSDIWREIGVTYYSAEMMDEARSTLEKFVARRSADAKGAYYLGMVLKAQGETLSAKELFQKVLELENAAPDFRRAETRKWGCLAKKEI